MKKEKILDALPGIYTLKVLLSHNCHLAGVNIQNVLRQHVTCYGTFLIRSENCRLVEEVPTFSVKLNAVLKSVLSVA
jgi:hypothetical protein